ncbi:IQ motif and SEC7 domain-containing protein 1-like isoform X2 [Patiria miniata]|uniref:SEC7 domain-containing protein n=1 Tax=Patiria miniata TaxID=46514 RepID=A0A914ADM1_PATMI|nr:IQ motif and SEC7 domain-containing protein 1-like isoform X2 [Patiria miniata]
MGNVPVTEALGRSGSYNMSPQCDPHEVETLSSVDLASRQPAPIEEKPQPEQHSQEPEDLLSSRSVAEKARHFNLKVEEVSNESSSRRTKPIDLTGTPTRTIAIQTEKDSSVRRDGKSKLPIVRWNTLESSSPGLGASPSFQRSTSIPDGQVRPRFDITPRPKAPRGSLRREKSIQQRREDERHIQKSRELSNSYELSSDLKNKQVEMLEKRYGGRIRAHHAAKVIQEAFRQHNMKKEFQRLRRTPSESRISRYLDSHSKQWGIGGSRARVMVIGSSGPTSPVSTKTPLKGIQELGAVEQLRGIETVGAEKKKHKVHHNNSNNVTPKRGLVASASPDLKVKADGDASSAERSRLSSQTVVVTLTMHRQSDESDTCSHTSTDSTPLGSRDDLTARGDNQSSSPANVATTEKTIKMVIQNTELRDGGGRAFSCRLGSPGQVACAKRLPFDDLDQTPQVRDSTKNEPTALTEDKASVDQSEATQIDFKDEIVTGEDVVEVANKVEHEMEQDEPGTVVPAPEEPVMETTFEVSVQEESCASPSTPTGTSSGEVESPLVPAISMENRKTVVSKAVIKEGKASPSTKRAKKSPKSKNGEDISPKKKNWPFSRSKSGDRTRKGSPTNSPKPQRHNPRASVQRESTESVQKQPSSSEEVHEGNVQGKLHVDSPLQYRKSSSSSTDSQNISIEPKPSITQPNEDPYERPRMHTVGSVEALAKKKSAQESEKMRSNSLSSGDLGDRSDQISLASTVTTSDFDRESMQDVPAVTVATPEGSLTMLDKIISTSSIDSDSDDEDEVHTPCQKRASLPIVSLSGHTASTPPTSASKQLVSRVQSASGMESPIWKRKSQNTKVATRNGTLVNGTAGVPSKTLARSETGDSMSSEGSNSSCRFTVGDDSSITDSLDSLSLESSFMESLEKRPIDPMLSIPMTAVRWRRYRIGLNLFNKKPEKGIKFLVDNKFVENSPNEVAKFLLNRTGLSKAKIGEYLGNLQKEFNMLVLECYVDEMNFRDLCIDEALRKFQTAFRLPGEAQKIERLMEAFAQRYCICNGDVTRAFQKPDTIFILAFAIIMLNTDLHSPNNKPERRMKLQDFLKNLSGIDDGCDIDPELLHGIYNRIRQHPFQPGMDHTSIVFKIEQNITGNRPILAEPHRRLVRDCSLSEVYDPTKKDKKHPRHVFLFNDMLMVTKLYKKKTGSIYGFKKAFPLHTACVLDFSSQYYPHGIRLVAAMNNRTLITFCANSQEEKMKFVADLRETVQEVNEMEDIRIGVYPPREMCPWEAELERQKIVRKSQASTADSGLGLDTESFASTQNLSGSMDSLAPQASDSGTLKRTALSNSLMDLKEASAKKNHRNSASSLDSGVTLDINATMPLPRKNRTGTNPVSSVFSTRRNKVTQPTFDLSTAGNSDTSDS